MDVKEHIYYLTKELKHVIKARALLLDTDSYSPGYYKSLRAIDNIAVIDVHTSSTTESFIAEYLQAAEAEILKQHSADCLSLAFHCLTNDIIEPQKLIEFKEGE